MDTVVSTPIELSQARSNISPSEAFQNLSNEARQLNIDCFDCYGDQMLSPNNSWLRTFEMTLASHFGMEDAVFLPSGIMAQMVTLSVNREFSDSLSKDSFLCHYSSHILLHENDAHVELIKMKAIVVPAKHAEEFQNPMSFSDTSSLILSTLPSTVLVECPHREIGGKCTSWEDLIELSKLCKEKGIKLHMDGARLWEAAAFYCTSNDRDIKSLCKLFDSIYVSFYKGLGGLTGAMLLGNKAFITKSRVWIRRFGGNLFTLAPYAISAYVGFKNNVDTFQAKRDRLRHVIALVSRLVMEEAEAVDSSNGGQASVLVRFDPPIPSVSLIHVYLYTDIQSALLARDECATICGINPISRNLKEGRYGATGQVYFEMNMGPANFHISDEDWITGWRTYLSVLRRTVKE
mmetsp:Transcript_33355/g.48341  ORF Transcript_33355/g.48341 Transcript_33355/m.48341 type:complete len:405 (+) Transcript_33355:76-1290(+)